MYLNLVFRKHDKFSKAIEAFDRFKITPVEVYNQAIKVLHSQQSLLFLSILETMGLNPSRVDVLANGGMA